MIKSDLYTENNMDTVSCSDVIQVVLDVAGSIPVVGDAAQAAVGEAVGKAGNAVLRAMPVLVPLMANLPDIFQKLKDSMPKGKNLAPKRAVTTAKAAKACSGMSKGKVQTGAKKSKSGGTKDLNREKTSGKAVCVNGKCFTADTLVLTKSGLRPIKEICKGDDIYSRNEETGETGFQKVKEVFVTEAHTIYHIWLDGKEEVKTTAYHSFFVKDRGWVTAIQLREADLLETAEGTAGITGITKVRHDEPVDVYNFHVDEWNSFFVSKGLIYVHNNEIEHVLEKHSLSNEEVRQWYKDRLAEIDKSLDKNAPLEQQARQAHAMRNEYRTRARELMKDRAEAARLDREHPHLTWEEAVRKYESKGYTGDEVYKQIIGSSQRSNSEVDKRWLKNIIKT